MRAMVSASHASLACHGNSFIDYRLQIVHRYVEILPAYLDDRSIEGIPLAGAFAPLIFAAARS